MVKQIFNKEYQSIVDEGKYKERHDKIFLVIRKLIKLYPSFRPSNQYYENQIDFKQQIESSFAQIKIIFKEQLNEIIKMDLPNNNISNSITSYTTPKLTLNTTV